jgi:hypothetical protein
METKILYSRERGKGEKGERETNVSNRDPIA